MAKILVVEDDADKLRRVLLAIQEVPGIAGSEVEDARDVAAAKRALRATAYDLLVLDISLPARPDVPPSPDAGIALLRELAERDTYKRPGHIVGLTAFSEAMEAAVPEFGDDLWLVVQYDAASEVWRDKLKRRVRHILLVENEESDGGIYKTQLCVVTALHTPELAAVRRLPWRFESFELPTDGTVYYRGSYSGREGAGEVIAAAAPRMGMAASAVLAAKMICAFRPRYLAMVGILAGVRGTCALGDIIVADPTWDYGSGKRHVKNGSAAFSAAPHQIGLSPSIRGKLGRMAADRSTLDEISRGWQAGVPDTPLKMYLGPVASGAAVLADESVTETIKAQHRKTVGVEMETYGVFVAAEEAAVPAPTVFSVKSVCDFADENKNDSQQAYAAFTSAEALRYFMERYV